MSQKQKQAALDTLQRDSLAILDDQWLADIEATIRASEEQEPETWWARFRETVKAAA